MSTRHIYSQEQIQFLRENVEGISLSELTKKFNKCFGTQITENAIANQKVKYGLKSGIVGGRFEKGCVPKNKGKKMSREQYSKCESTMFKPGNKPKNTDPIGTEKELKDGYIWVKIDDQLRVPKNVNWKQKHKLIYEKHFGPVPKGSVVIFKDGDIKNFDIDNLACVTKAQLLIMNRQKLIYKDKKLTESGIQIAKMIDVVNIRKKNMEVLRNGIMDKESK